MQSGWVGDLPHSSEQSHSRACSVVPMCLLAYVHSDRTSKVDFASCVESGRSTYSGGGRKAILCEAVRDSLGAFPGSIFKVISPPSTSSCVFGSGVEASEGSCLTGDCDLNRGLLRAGIGRGVGVRASRSTFTRAGTAAPSPEGEAPSSSFMPRRSGPSSAVWSDSWSDMVADGRGGCACAG